MCAFMCAHLCIYIFVCPCAPVCGCVCSLGLGATYVPHQKAVGFAAAIDERLKKRLESGAKRKAAMHMEEEGGEQVCRHASLHGRRLHACRSFAHCCCCTGAGAQVY